ncbi:SPOR domain-containing protein [Vibrio cincinnatiensis]|nr:SPOR domain-containing protein [Vibrio cincinnatiensis]
MDIKVLEMSKITHRVLLSLSCCTVVLFSFPVLAQDFLCDATQAASDQLPVLDSSCPLGQGLWGNTLPKGQDSKFWIQCGLLASPLSVEQAKALYEKISTDVWMKPEGSGTRCLIGPYNDYAQARKELTGVRALAGYKEAFLREVSKSIVSQSQPQGASVQRQPTPVKTRTPTARPLKSPPPIQPDSDAIVIRHQTSFNGLTYAIPYTTSDKVQFYMEHNQAWNRLNYSGAKKMCESQNMRLVTEEEWQQLLSSKVMEKEQWPMYLPYWGQNNRGLFTSGKITNLKGNSLLSVVCVKSAME